MCQYTVVKQIVLLKQIKLLIFILAATYVAPREANYARMHATQYRSNVSSRLDREVKEKHRSVLDKELLNAMTRAGIHPVRRTIWYTIVRLCGDVVFV